jgi:hypothetical protein
MYNKLRGLAKNLSLTKKVPAGLEKVDSKEVLNPHENLFVYFKHLVRLSNSNSIYITHLLAQWKFELFTF